MHRKMKVFLDIDTTTNSDTCNKKQYLQILVHAAHEMSLEFNSPLTNSFRRIANSESV